MKRLAKNMRKGKTVKGNKTKYPIMPDAFETRTYFEYGNINKMFLIHNKNDRLQNFDALLEIHDVPYPEMLEIEQILHSSSCVKEFHFCRIELRWDFYPAENNIASELQSALVKHMHLAKTPTSLNHLLVG